MANRRSDGVLSSANGVPSYNDQLPWAERMLLPRGAGLASTAFHSNRPFR